MKRYFKNLSKQARRRARYREVLLLLDTLQKPIIYLYKAYQNRLVSYYSNLKHYNRKRILKDIKKYIAHDVYLYGDMTIAYTSDRHIERDGFYTDNGLLQYASDYTKRYLKFAYDNDDIDLFMLIEKSLANDSSVRLEKHLGKDLINKYSHNYNPHKHTIFLTIERELLEDIQEGKINV